MKPDERSAAYQRFYALIDSIPKGRVATYGQIAREAGLPRHARMVGRALRELKKGSELPWHRVLNASGELRAGPASLNTQIRRLEREGVARKPNGRVDLKVFQWRPDWGA